MYCSWMLLKCRCLLSRTSKQSEHQASHFNVDVNLHDMMELKLGSMPTMKCWAIKGYYYVLPHCFCECWDASNSVVLLSKGVGCSKCNVLLW